MHFEIRVYPMDISMSFIAPHCAFESGQGPYRDWSEIEVNKNNFMYLQAFDTYIIIGTLYKIN